MKCLHFLHDALPIFIKTKPTYYVFVDILLINPSVKSQLCQFWKKAILKNPKTVNISKTVRDIKKTNRKISPDSTPCRFWTFPIKCIYFYVYRTLNTRATKFDDDIIKYLHVNNS